MIPLIYRDMEPLQKHFFQMSNHRDQTCDSSSISLVMLQYYMNTCSKERTAVKKCVVPGERLGTTHFGIYPFYWSLLFELYDYIISTVYGFDDWLVDFLYHFESEIVGFLPV